MRAVHVGPLTVLPAVAILLGVLAVDPGLGVAAVLTGAVVGVVTWLLRGARAAARGLTRLGAGQRRHAGRAALTAGLAALVVQSWTGHVPRSLVVVIASVALATRPGGRTAGPRPGHVTPFGAAFDMETDAFLILVLSVYVVPLVGPWVLLIGLARYLLRRGTARLAMADAHRSRRARGPRSSPRSRASC